MELVRKISNYTPFIWLKLIYRHEKSKVFKKNEQVLDINSKIQQERSKPWFEADGNKTHRIDYDLNDKSIVFDLGGYKGEFVSDIFNKYNCNVYVFEPLKEFYDVIVNKFSNNRKIKPYCFGLSNKTELSKLSNSDNSSSIFITDKDSTDIQLKSIIEFIEEYNISSVDLIKINIEGAEYDILESLIKNDKIEIFKNIQVQFHDFIISNAKERMNNIQKGLSKTHYLTYQYEFVWENWKRKQ